MLTRSRGLGGSPAVYGNRHTQSYDSRASGGSLYPLAGARGKYGGKCKALLGRSMSSREGKMEVASCSQ